MMILGAEHYVPTIRFKRGEYQAYRLLDNACKERTRCVVVFPPLSTPDQEKKRQLTLKETIEIQTTRIAENWSTQPLFADWRYLRFDNDAARDSESLRNFIDEAELRRCKITPVFDFSTPAARLNVLKEVIARDKRGAALRVDFARLGHLRSATEINERLSLLEVHSEDTVLILDLAEAVGVATDAFATFVSEWLLAARQVGQWRRIVVSASNYPEKNPATPNSIATIPRTEWLAWREMTRKNPWVADVATFGDFGADHGNMRFRTGGRVVTHMRYATADGWLVCRGGPSTDAIDGSIRGVATKITKSKWFAGETFSAGDEDIAGIAANEIGPGGATEWRRINMNHHFSQVVVDVGKLVGAPAIVATARRRHQQQTMKLV